MILPSGRTRPPPSNTGSAELCDPCLLTVDRGPRPVDATTAQFYSSDSQASPLGSTGTVSTRESHPAFPPSPVASGRDAGDHVIGLACRAPSRPRVPHEDTAQLPGSPGLLPLTVPRRPGESKAAPPPKFPTSFPRKTPASQLGEDCKTSDATLPRDRAQRWAGRKAGSPTSPIWPVRPNAVVVPLEVGLFR